jgi:hypothetical protein
MGYSGTIFARNSQDASITHGDEGLYVMEKYRTTLLTEEFFFLCSESGNETGASILEPPYVVRIHK